MEQKGRRWFVTEEGRVPHRHDVVSIVVFSSGWPSGYAFKLKRPMASVHGAGDAWRRRVIRLVRGYK